MNEALLITVEDGVGLLTLDRPERLNALTAEMGEQLERAMVRLGLDEAVRVIVVTGAGKGFCAGADVARLDELSTGTEDKRMATRPGAPQPVLDVFADSDPAFRTRYLSPMAVPKPVIAAVNGACAGIGLALVAACDLRFAAGNAVFTAVFPRRGLIAEGGLAWTLPPLIGHGAACDLLLSGRRIDAAEALRIGLVNAIHAPEILMANVMAYARDLARNASPRSMRIIKRQLQAARSQTALEATQSSFDQTVASLRSEDFREGLAAFKEKRAPRFVGR